MTNFAALEEALKNQKEVALEAPNIVDRLRVVNALICHRNFPQVLEMLEMSRIARQNQLGDMFVNACKQKAVDLLMEFIKEYVCGSKEATP